MKNYVCTLCGYAYRPALGDEDNGIEAGTEFDEIDENWTCPLCGASKEDFELAEDSEIDD